MTGPLFSGMGGHHSARKACTTCKTDLPVEDFGLRKGKPRSQCRPCVNLGNQQARERRRAKDPEAYKADTARWNRRVREKRGPEKEKHFNRKTRLACKYKLTLEDFDRLFAEQGSACLICHATGSSVRWVVDHDHQSGAVRGILCAMCNTGLGQFSDDPDRLRSAADYLERARVGRGKWRAA